MGEYLEKRVDERVCDRRCAVSFVAGAVFMVTLLVFTKPDSTMLPSNIVAARTQGSLERELIGCVRALDTTAKTADFWRDAAMAMRTEGVDSLRPVPEGKP